MLLNNQTPIEVPAVAAKVYDKLHPYSLNVMHPTPTDSGSITIELLPATADGELATGDRVQRMSCPLYPALSEVPELAAAFNAVLAAIPATQAWLASQNQQEEAPNE